MHVSILSYTLCTVMLCSLLFTQYCPDMTSAKLAQHVLYSFERKFPLNAPLWLHYEIAYSLMGTATAQSLQLLPAPQSLCKWYQFSSVTRLGSFRWFCTRSLLQFSSWLAHTERYGEFVLQKNRLFLQAFVAIPLKGAKPSFALEHSSAMQTLM
jgi:hypothetical protein